MYFIMYVLTCGLPFYVPIYQYDCKFKLSDINCIYSVASVVRTLEQTLVRSNEAKSHFTSGKL